MATKNICKAKKNKGWIGFDLDGTLAEYHGWKGPQHIGNPIPATVKMVRSYLSQEYEVRILTARACVPSQVFFVKRWLSKIAHLPKLRVTCKKDYGLLLFYDDRVVEMIPNTGIPIATLLPNHLRTKYNIHLNKTIEVKSHSDEYMKACMHKRKQSNKLNSRSNKNICKQPCVYRGLTEIEK
jgi:hypothetical protein